MKDGARAFHLMSLLSLQSLLSLFGFSGAQAPGAYPGTIRVCGGGFGEVSEGSWESGARE
jgi:hypothetical protein